MVCKCISHGSDATCAVLMPTRLMHVAVAVNSVPLSTSFGSVMLRNGAAGVVMPVATTCPNALRTLNAHDSTPDSGSVNSRGRVGELQQHNALLWWCGVQHPHDRATLGGSTRTVLHHQFRVVRDAVTRASAVGRRGNFTWRRRDRLQISLHYKELQRELHYARVRVDGAGPRRTWSRAEERLANTVGDRASARWGAVINGASRTERLGAPACQVDCDSAARVTHAILEGEGRCALARSAEN
eukprot:scaffold1989_cov75-Phaeocystis_antarctica.AAC.1